jgi:GNAT superfamily N-acetyltransferase
MAGTGTREGHDDLFERMLEPVRHTVRSLADEVEPIGSGWVARTPSLPMVWSLNQLRLTGSTTFGDAVALAEEHQGDMPYRHVEVEGDDVGGELVASFRAAGWTAEREVYMALAEPPGDAADAGKIVELTEGQALSLMRLWIVEDHPGIPDSSTDQLEESSRREGRLWQERRFGILAEYGSPLSMTKLRGGGTTAWVEDVYTVSEARGRGYARLLVTYVTALAVATNPELTFIIADDNDWPKELYAKVGFRPIDRTYTFHLDLRNAP